MGFVDQFGVPSLGMYITLRLEILNSQSLSSSVMCATVVCP